VSEERRAGFPCTEKKYILNGPAYRPTMEVVHKPEQGKFMICLAPRAYAFLRYELRGRTMYIRTVYTPPEFRGRGVATRLMEHALKWAEGNGYKVVPVCSFAASFFEKRTEWRRVLEEQPRESGSATKA